jgi:transposase-like protein
VERGLRRVLIIIHDDFSGLLGLTQGMFPNSDVQLCTVHMLRNAKTHLSKDDSAEFTKRFRSIKNSWDAEVGATHFEELCQRFEKSAPTFVKELREKRNHYLFFLNYPDGVRRTLSTTNAVEAINKAARDPPPKQWRLLPFRGNRETQTGYRGHLTRVRKMAPRCR